MLQAIKRIDVTFAFYAGAVLFGVASCVFTLALIAELRLGQ